MLGIKFKIDGFVNSFRQIDFKTYHKTYLTPTRNNILGLLTNILGKNEKFYYDLVNNDNIVVQIKLLSIKGFIKDLWHFKNKQQAGGVIRRERLFSPCYEIELILLDDNNDLLDKFYNGLKNPQRIPSLGMDDEIVKIYDVEKCKFEEEQIDKLDKTIFVKNFPDFKFIPKENMFIHYPIIYSNYAKWKIEYKNNKRVSRKGYDVIYFPNFLGGTLKLDKTIKIYKASK